MFWFESSTDVNLCSLICSLTRLQLLQFPCTVVLLYGQVIEGCCKRSQWSPSTSLVFLCTGDEKKQTALSFDFHWISVHYWLCLGINSHCVQGHEAETVLFNPPPHSIPHVLGGFLLNSVRGMEPPNQVWLSMIDRLWCQSLLFVYSMSSHLILW